MFCDQCLTFLEHACALLRFSANRAFVLFKCQVRLNEDTKVRCESKIGKWRIVKCKATESVWVRICLNGKTMKLIQVDLELPQFRPVDKFFK